MKDKKQARRFLALAAAFLAIVILSGGYIFYQKSGKGGGTDVQYHDTMLYMGFASEDGIYHLNSTGFLYFFDYATQKDVIVCNKPNCTHKIWYENTPDEQRCNAYLPDVLGGAGFVQEDALYLFNTDLNTQTGSLVRSGLDRTGVKEVASFENNIVSPFVVDGQFLYMSGCSILTEKDEDGMEAPSGENETWLFRVNLNTGETTNLTERKKAYSSDLYIVGYYNGRIYYKENLFETKYDGTNYEEAGHRVDWYFYDIEEGKSERIYEDEAFQDAYLYGDKLVSMYGKGMATEVYKDGLSAQGRYSQIDISVWDLAGGKGQWVVTADKLLDYADGKVFYVIEETGKQRYFYYDIEEGETVEMDSGFMKRLHIRGSFGDYLLVIKDDTDTGFGDYFVIPKQDFYNGKENYIPITWKEEP